MQLLLLLHPWLGQQEIEPLKAFSVHIPCVEIYQYVSHSAFQVEENEVEESSSRSGNGFHPHLGTCSRDSGKRQPFPELTFCGKIDDRS